MKKDKLLIIVSICLLSIVQTVQLLFDKTDANLCFFL